MIIETNSEKETFQAEKIWQKKENREMLSVYMEIWGWAKRYLRKVLQKVWELRNR
jgi:hypothetical protein